MWTVISRLPSGKTASSCTRGIMSATPGITSSNVSAWAASVITSSSVMPARAPSSAAAEMRATASGWLSLRPFAFRFSSDVGDHVDHQFVELAWRQMHSERSLSIMR